MIFLTSSPSLFSGFCILLFAFCFLLFGTRGVLEYWKIHGDALDGAAAFCFLLFAFAFVAHERARASTHALHACACMSKAGSVRERACADGPCGRVQPPAGKTSTHSRAGTLRPWIHQPSWRVFTNLAPRTRPCEPVRTGREPSAMCVRACVCA